jgi:WD40 repeat protein
MTLFGHHAAVNSVILKGGHIATASGDRTIKLWDKDGKLLKTFIGHARGIACLAYDGETLVSGSSDHQIRIWNISSGTVILYISIYVYIAAYYNNDS